jgi:hypothetical protein
VPNGVLVTAKIPQTSKYLQVLLKKTKIFIRLLVMSKKSFIFAACLTKNGHEKSNYRRR